MTLFRFASPYWLLLMAVLPLWFRGARRRLSHPVMASPRLTVLRGAVPSMALRLSRPAGWLKPLAFCLMAAALARPQWGFQKMEADTRGVNIILAVDISESMAALDFRRKGKIVNRLEAVKGVVQEFVQNRTGDRIGLVVFGTHAYTQIPLTRDYATIVSVLDRIAIGAAGKKTAVGDAIGISLKRLADIRSPSNIIILLTDGQSNSGELTPEAAATVAVHQKVKVYTIGVGTRGEAPFLLKDPLFGERYVYQQVDMDEDALKRIADQTGGLYFRAEDTEGLENIYRTIDGLEKTEEKVPQYAAYEEMYLYFLFPAFLLLVLDIVLANTRLLRVP